MISQEIQRMFMRHNIVGNHYNFFEKAANFSKTMVFTHRLKTTCLVSIVLTKKRKFCFKFFYCLVTMTLVLKSKPQRQFAYIHRPN